MSYQGKQVSVVILAAGTGSRMKADGNKLFLTIKRIPILFRTLYRLNQFNIIDSIILVCQRTEREKIEKMILEFGALSKLKEMVDGGKERSDSVNCGLERISMIQEKGLVMTHDAARPFISESLMQRLLKSVEDGSISIPALKVVETVRKIHKSGITSVVDRDYLYSVQTPQVFHVSQIQSCFLSKDKQALNLTDEASYFEAMGKKVCLVEGEKWNIKITSPGDIEWAESLIDKHRQLKLEGLDK